jgi:hypothetical protein
MSDETWRGIIIRSIPPTANWLPVIPSLYTMATSADIISTLCAHGMILTRYYTTTAIGVNSPNTALAAQTTNSDSGGLGCTNPDCKAKIRSTHTTANCYWPGGGKEGQFPPDFGTRSRASVATSEQTGHFALSARVWNTPGHSGILIGTPTHYPSNPTSTVTKTTSHTRTHNTVSLPTATKILNTKHQTLSTRIRKANLNGHSGTSTMTNRAPAATLFQSFRRGRIMPTGSDSLPQPTKRKPTAYPSPSLTPHTDSGSVTVPLTNHFTDLDFDNAINDSHHINRRELDISDISDVPRQSTYDRMSASVREQLSTPLAVVTGTMTYPIINNHHVNRLLVNDDQHWHNQPPISVIPTDHHHDFIHYNQVIDNEPVIADITAVTIPVESRQSIMVPEGPEQHEAMFKGEGQDSTVNWSSSEPLHWQPTPQSYRHHDVIPTEPTASENNGYPISSPPMTTILRTTHWQPLDRDNDSDPTGMTRKGHDNEVQRIKDVGETLAAWRISREIGDLEMDDNFIVKPYNPPHPAVLRLRFNVTTSTAARTILLLLATASGTLIIRRATQSSRAGLLHLHDAALASIIFNTTRCRV